MFTEALIFDGLFFLLGEKFDVVDADGRFLSPVVVDDDVIVVTPSEFLSTSDDDFNLFVLFFSNAEIFFVSSCLVLTVVFAKKFVTDWVVSFISFITFSP